MFEAGTFYTLLAIAFIILLFKLPYREFLFWLSGGIFVMLGFVVFSSTDVAFEVSTTDGINIINQTNYIIGNPHTVYNESAMGLAYILVVLGIVVGLIGLAMWANPPKNPTGGIR